jgi:hypothetical protein
VTKAASILGDQMNRHRHTEIQRYIHRDRDTDTETHTHTHTHTHAHTHTHTHRHTDTQTHRHTDTQTHRHLSSLDGMFAYIGSPSETIFRNHQGASSICASFRLLTMAPPHTLKANATFKCI